MTEHLWGPARTLSPSDTGPNTSPNALHSPSDEQGHLPSGHELEDEIRQACNGRLIDFHWFRTDWQRGGASTAKGLFIKNDLETVNVVIKFPIPAVERLWLKRLSDAGDDIVPEVFAHGDRLGNYAIDWIVMEYLPHGPLSSKWDGMEFDLLVEAYGRMADAMDQFKVDEEPPGKDWEAIWHKSRENVHAHAIANEQRWNKALKQAHRHLKDWLIKLDDQPIDHWVHGDLHLGNALSRVAPPSGPALLIDFACVHAGHWLDDAVYLEHLYWARRDMLKGRKLCSMIAKQRKQHGLRVCADWPQWAQIHRALLAMSTPAMLEHDGSPAHVEAALEILEASV
jgi:hypothetical protein